MPADREHLTDAELVFLEVPLLWGIRRNGRAVWIVTRGLASQLDAATVEAVCASLRDTLTKLLRPKG